MTCIVAIKNSNRVIIGADSCGSEENIGVVRVPPKVFVKGNYGFGFSHSFRLGQIIEHVFEPPPISSKVTDNELIAHMVKNFIPQLKSTLEDHGYPYHEDEKEGWALIIGIHGRILTIESDWQVGLDDLDLTAIGSGAEYALGALYVSDKEPLETATAALMAANKFCPSVMTPFNFIEV
jgi:ATP-dependent protease HslVU (ClpYQ) peptidase subunit